jgi:hypothetical protein
MKGIRQVTMTIAGQEPVTVTGEEFASTARKMKQQDAVTVRLFKMFGCRACKAQNTHDEFLTSHERFFCMKQKRSFGVLDNPHNDCATWQFGGDEGQLKAATDPTPNLPD